jgi:environmental stress-induced protein Ves
MTKGMTLLRAAERGWIPWKNGGGVQADILIRPEGADFETMELRLSIARIAASGPFSHFAGIDRSTLVIAGRGLALTIGEAAPVQLSAGDPPLRYPGDVPTRADIGDGPLEVLNVMARRDRISHRLARHDLPAGARLTLPPQDGCLVWIAGAGEIVGSDVLWTPAPQDALPCTAQQPLTVTARTPASFALAGFTPL